MKTLNTKKRVINFTGFASVDADAKSRALSYMLYHLKQTSNGLDFNCVQRIVTWLSGLDEQEVASDIHRIKSGLNRQGFTRHWQEAVAIELFQLMEIDRAYSSI